MQTFIVGSSTALGIMGAGVLYFPAAIVNCLNWVQAKQKVKTREHSGADLNRLLFV